MSQSPINAEDTTPRFRFRSLVSGSSANATLVESFQAGRVFRALVDCGLNMRQLEKHLARESLSASMLDAVFVTHEHSDHVGCCFDIGRKWQVPVWTSRGTYEGAGSPDVNGALRIIRDGETFEWGSMQVNPFTVPHDAREPLQLSISQGEQKLTLLTDLGHVTDHVLSSIDGSHAIVIESNHDPELLLQSKYPAFLKRRISGKHGHLPNNVAGQILSEIYHPGLQHVVAAHLSRQNNQPELARSTLADALGWHTSRVHVATQEAGCSWIDLGLGPVEPSQPDGEAAQHSQP